MRKNGDTALAIAERRPDRSETVLDLARGLIDGHPVEGEGVILAVVGDRMAFIVGAPAPGADRPSAMRPTMKKVAFTHSEASTSRIAVRVGRQRAVVEGQDHFVVVERQRFLVLQGAEKRMLASDRRTMVRLTPRAFGLPGHSAAAAEPGRARRQGQPRTPSRRRRCAYAQDSNERAPNTRLRERPSH